MGYAVGDLRTSSGHGDVWIGVPVRCYTECNIRSWRKTDIRYLKLQISWKAHARLNSIPKSIYDTLTTSSRFTRAINGKTTFCTHYGSFKWCVMAFRLTNAPAAFQHLMNNIFSDLLDMCPSLLERHPDLSRHARRTPSPCPRSPTPAPEQLYAHGDKCSFHDDTVEYLSFILSPNGLTMDPSKVNTVLEWPEPHKVKDIQSFLGFANFYRQFISDYWKFTVPWTWLTCNGTLWDFSDACQNSFESLKKVFTTAPVLAKWNPRDPLIVETNASNYTLGAILSTIDPSNNQVHPIAFHSQNFMPPVLNYNVHDKELLAIFEASTCGTITLKELQFWLTLSQITRILNISWLPKFWCDDKPVGWNSSLNSTSWFISTPENSEPNRMCWLDDGTFILKRGKGIMQLLILTISDLYSLMSSLHPASKQPYSFPQYSEPPQPWISKHFIPTFTLHSLLIPLSPNTSLTLPSVGL